MSHSQRSLLPAGGRAVLLSIKPKYADMILAGTKTVELRRAWAAQEVATIVIYASSPVQRLVGIVDVNEVKEASPTQLWKVSQIHGGGLSNKELKDYYKGKTKGFAVMLGNVHKAKSPIEPESVFTQFVPPQSFRYLDEQELKQVRQKLLGKKGKL